MCLGKNLAHTKNEEYKVKVEKSPELSYIMTNLVVGDGGVYCYNTKDKTSKDGVRVRYLVQLTSVDREYVENFNRHICTILEKKRIATIGIKKVSLKHPTWHDLYRVYIYCKKEFYDWVKGCSKEFLAELWREYPHQFLQSWFDSDGTVYQTNGRVTLELSNSKKEWLEFAQNLLKEQFGIEIGLYFNQHLFSGKMQWQLQTAKRETIQLFNKQIGFGIIRKQEVLKRI